MARSTGRWFSRRSRVSRHEAESLRESAGRARRSGDEHDRAALEPLENRQYMFTLTITPDVIDPFTGVGQVAAFFAYAIPNLSTTVEQQDNDPRAYTENFNDEAANLVGPVANGQEFAQSRLVLRHSILPAVNMQLVANLDQQGQIQTNTQRLRARLNNGQTMTFFFLAGQENTDVRSPLTTLSIDMAAGPNSNTGLDIANTVVTLSFQGAIVAQYTGANLGALNTTAPGTGVGTFTFTTGQFNPIEVFDTITFTATAGPQDPFELDNFAGSGPSGGNSQLIDSRVFGGSLILTGRAGTSVQIFDLYGRDMVETLAMGRPQGDVPFALADLNDDGVPDFNDGIGRIEVLGSTAETTLTVFGGTVESGDPDPDAVFSQGGFNWLLPQGVAGLYNDFESAGYGFTFQPQVDNPVGLPDGSGAVIIGAPFIRDNSSDAAYDPYGLAVDAPITENFVRADQGIFVRNGASIGRVYVYGILNGSSQFGGAVDQLIVGTLHGSIAVEGDLGSLYVSSDAGVWVRDDGAETVATGSQLVVGRTVNEISIAGASLMDVTVVGDTSVPDTRPPRDALRYFEKEFSYGIDEAAQYDETDFLRSTMFGGYQFGLGDFLGLFFIRDDQGLIYGDSVFRNDSLITSEWVGSFGTAVRINGDLGFGDPAVFTGEDAGDVYGFAADGSQEVVIEVDAGTFLLFRVMDINGRTVASSELPLDGASAQHLRFRPDAPGVYYLAVTDTGFVDGETETGLGYTVTISGMASTTLGAYRTGGSNGFADLFSEDFANTINVIAGSVGSLRIGTGFQRGDGEHAGPEVVINSTARGDGFDPQWWRPSTFTTPGNLYNITTGSDILGDTFSGQVVQVIVGGNFGNLITGQSPVSGVNSSEGDVQGFTLSVGGTISLIDIKGGVGLSQDNNVEPDPIDFPDSVSILSGRTGGPGHIGLIRVGNHVGGDTLNVVTSPNSIVGGFLVSQDVNESNRPDIGIYAIGNEGFGAEFDLGAGSDLRFFDVPQIDLQNLEDAFQVFSQNVPLILTDDGGGRVQIRVVGGNALAGGLVRVLPIDGSQGVAIGRIEVNLAGGAVLEITSLDGNPGDVISIGNIIITGSGPGSGVRIDGLGQIDVWRIQQTGGEALNQILNLTPGGDLVAVDVVGLTSLEIRSGDLGRTQMPAGLGRFSPFLGISNQSGGGVNSPFGIDGRMNPDWNGEVYRQPNNAVYDPGTAFLDDVGSPLDPYLDGLIVRDGDITLVSVGGAVGDVITQTGNIIQVIANADGIVEFGRFQGIIGNIYSGESITRVDIGDGLAGPGSSSLPTASIIADNNIFLIVGERIAGADIRGLIIAANSTVGDNTPLGYPTDGIDGIRLSRGGDIVDAWIGSMKLDDWYLGVAAYPGDGRIYAGDINVLRGDGADFLRSEMYANNINTVELINGFYDASITNAADGILTFRAAGYRNSTLTGGDLEFRFNLITAGQDIGEISTFGNAGDFEDISIDALGSITGRISGRNFARTTLNIDNEISRLLLTGSMRGSNIIAGRLDSTTVSVDIVSSTFSISGPIESITADAIINSSINVTGAGGRIERITARRLISGSIASSGPIDTIEATEGDIVGVITTSSESGTINVLRAGRDLNISTSVQGAVNSLTAGRHIGAPDTTNIISIDANIQNISAPNGQIYADIRVGGNLTGTITIGAVPMLPGNDQVAHSSITIFGRLNAAVIAGDFAGQIVSGSGGIGSITINNGSLRSGALLSALDGDFNSLTINGGHLLGDVHADRILRFITVNASADGVFGDIGINPNLSTITATTDANRNQLPPGSVPTSGADGPRITAGWNIGRVLVTSGNVYEALFHAGRAIGTITINGDVANDPSTSIIGTVFAAGDSIFRIAISGDASNAIVMGGLVSFGDDGRPGGVGANADTVKAGRIRTVVISGDATNVFFTAGLNAGNDGVYNTGDDTVVLGVSRIFTLDLVGSLTNVSAYADSPFGDLPPFIVAGDSLRLADDQIDSGIGLPGTELTAGVAFNFTHQSVSGTITFNGPGRAFWDAALGRVVLRNTSLASTLLVTAGGALNDFDIVSNDDASIGSINVQAALTGDSDIVIDAFAREIRLGNVSGTGRIAVGADLRTLAVGNWTGGSFEGKFVRELIVAGNLGSRDSFTESFLSANGINSLRVSGFFAGVTSANRRLNSMVVQGAIDRGAIRSGGTIGTISAASMSESRVSAADAITTIAIAGDTFDSSIQAGGDLGTDGVPGGTGTAADVATTGTIGTVTVGGNFLASDIAAGSLRGSDGFFGTADDNITQGISSIGSISIDGTGVGSNINSESYRISSTGTIGTVTIGGQVGQDQGNFAIEGLDPEPLPIRVTSLSVTEQSFIFTANLLFNQDMDGRSIADALRISEVRGSVQLITLIEGVDYTITYDQAARAARVRFSTDVTRRDLPQTQGVPGQGVYRFELDSDVVRAKVVNARLDGDGDGFSTPGDDFSSDDFVGDAGDKLTSVTVGGFDFYGPSSLDEVMDSNHSSDGIADANRVFTLRGFIGDHPDHDVNNFRFAGDVDLYQITLQAGQILVLGRQTGSALFASRALLDESGNPLFATTIDPALFGGLPQVNTTTANQRQLGATTRVAQRLPNADPTEFDITTSDIYLVKETGTYFLMVSNTDTAHLSNAVPNIDPRAGSTADYAFDVLIFDDGNSGFAGPTDAGDGEDLVYAPEPIAFAGADLTFGTSDDQSSITINGYTFTLDTGNDGNPNTTDDIVSGVNAAGDTSTRSSAGLVQSVASAIGPARHTGLPDDVFPDLDVYHLNGGDPIAPGTVIKITVKLTDVGADLGTRISDEALLTFTDFTGSVQLALFDTTGSSTVEDAQLVFSPSDFLPTGGTPDTIIAQNGLNEYGFDENGDFYIQFLAPDRIGGTPGQEASFAVYLQGVFNTDYSLEIVTRGVSSQEVRRSQNIFIETNGGSVDWLQSTGEEALLDGFDAAALGFTGTIGGQDATEYILDKMIDNLDELFADLGLDITISTDPNDFEFQDFSTVFLSTVNDPINFFNEGIFGYSEHSDPFNTDRNDEAAVFLPSFTVLGYTPSRADADLLAQSLAGAAGRRVAELLGLRTTVNDQATSDIDPLAANSPINAPATGQSYTFANFPRALSVNFDLLDDTNFYLGQITSASLISKIVS